MVGDVVRRATWTKSAEAYSSVETNQKYREVRTGFTLCLAEKKPNVEGG